MKSKNASKYIPLLLAVAAFAESSNAASPESGDKLAIVPEVALSHRNYKWSYSIPGKSVDVFDVNFPSIRVGLNAGYGKFFGGVKYETSLGDVSASILPGFTNENYQMPYGASSQLDRKDLSLVGGYRFTDRISAFAGYLSGETSVDMSGLPTTLYSVDVSGPFVGAAYTIPVLGNSLSLKAAYSDLSGDISWYPVSSKVNGSGISLGAMMTGPFIGKTNYVIELDTYKYEYDNFAPDLTIEEEQLSLRFGINMVF
ncbi:hypothetical protein [Endothiovibrio diazotrophicus]